jgi:glycosyltransferase involved in cell wall biosynthesis
LELARGEFIQFLDADDMLYPNKVERQTAEFSDNPNEVVYCDYLERRMDGQGRPVPHSHICYEADSVLTVELGSIQTSSVLFRRSILEQLGGFRVGLPCCQDRELFLRMACHGVDFRRVPETLYLVRTLPVSVCANRTRVAEWGCAIECEWFDYLSSAGIVTEARRKAFACGLTRKARWLAAAGRRDEAKKWLSRAQEIHPSAWRGAYGRRESLLLRTLGFFGTEQVVQAAVRVRGYGSR